MSRISEGEPIPGLGTCRNDVRFTSRVVLDVLGVNYANNKVDAELILEHGIGNVRMLLALVIRSLERHDEVGLSPEINTLHTIENTLHLLESASATLAAILASSTKEEL